MTEITRPVLVNGAPGLIAYARGSPVVVMSLVTTGDQITQISILTDPTRLATLFQKGQWDS